MAGLARNRTCRAAPQEPSRRRFSSALLAGFFFAGAMPKGPPFGFERDVLLALLSPSFERVDARSVSGSLPVFGQHERWMSWRRRA